MSDTVNGTLVAKGDNGTVEFNGYAVKITRSGWTGRWDHGAGEKVIPVRQITGVEYQPGGLQQYGHLLIVMPGAKETRRGLRDRRNMRKDPNAVLFRGRKERRQFAEIRDAILAAMAG